jgi:hypothetical protein
MNALVAEVEERFDEITSLARGAANCARCGRTLTDPVSVKRGMGPICYRSSGGEVFDKDMDASDEEWARREKLLEAGGEIDLGVNWQYPVQGIGVGYTMRVSVRFREGQYEAYGFVNRYGHPDGDDEIVFCRSLVLKEAYQAAIEAGPRFTAMAHRARQRAIRAAARQSGLFHALQTATPEGATDHVRA